MEEEEAIVLNNNKAIVLNNNNNNKVDQELMDLPPGFRFHPTDEEIITHYVKEKVMNTSFSACAIGEVDLNKSEPWDLPKKAKMGEKEYYFFCRRDRKYPTGMRTNRATATGYWKATGKDREIYEGKGGCLVGMKKTLVFYQGRAPKGEKSNWVMHEYRLEGKFSYYNLPKAARDEWVVCRVFHKNSGGIKKNQIPGLQMNDHSFGDHYFFDKYASLPPLMDPSTSTSIPNHGDDQNEFKPINTAASTSSRSHIYQNQLFSSYQNNNPNPASYLHQAAISSSLATSHLHHYHDLDYNSSSHCKAHEQLSSNQSMISLSRDTGLSTDMNTTTEISSVVSKQADNKSYEDHLDAISIAELDSFWDY